MARLHLSIGGLMGLVLALAVGLVSLRFASEAWAGVVLLVTLGALSLAILGVVYRRGATRASWLGFALLGWGYMALVSDAWWDLAAKRPELVTTMILDRLYPHLHADREPIVSLSTVSRFLGVTVDRRSQAILKKLEDPISMSFANATPLEDVLKYIKSATTGPNDSGIPIYVDPVGLQQAEKTMMSPVALDVEGVPLRSTLRLVLAQIGLAYEVKDGLLAITAASAPSGSFRRIGHCYWALLAAWLGGIADRRFHGTRAASAGT